MTTPSQWTTSYADTFRDRTKFISPTSDQQMHHYPGEYDKSHFGDNNARGAAATQRGRSNGQSNGQSSDQYQSQYASQTQSSESFGTTSSGAVITNTSQIPNAIANPNGFGLYFPKAVPGGKDLWNTTPNSTHGGIAPLGGVHGDSNIRYQGRNLQNNSSSHSSDAAGSYNNEGFDNNGSLGDDARPKYHVPGYSGFVRGTQFRYGDTYSKMTRMALDVPTNTPLEP